MWLGLITLAYAGTHADLYAVSAKGAEMAVVCSSSAEAADRVGRLVKGMGKEMPPVPPRFRALFDPALGASVVDADGPLSMAVTTKAGSSVTVSFATHRSTEEVAKALAAASGGVAFAAERGWVVRNDEGKELTVLVDAGVATASLGVADGTSPVVNRAVVEAVPETPGCVAVMHLDTPETGAMDLAIHLPFAPDTPTSFAIATPKLTEISGVAPHPQVPVPVLTQAPPAAVLVVGVGLDGVNFSRFLHGKDLRQARRLQRWFPITSGTTLALTSAGEPLGFGAAVPLSAPLQAEVVAKRAGKLLGKLGGPVTKGDGTHFSTEMKGQTLYFGAEEGRLLVSSSEATLAEMEAHAGTPWVQGVSADMATRFPIVLVSSVLPDDSGKGVKRMDPPATFGLALDPGLVRGEVYLPLTVEEFARLCADVAAQAEKAKGDLLQMEPVVAPTDGASQDGAPTDAAPGDETPAEPLPAP